MVKIGIQRDLLSRYDLDHWPKTLFKELHIFYLKTLDQWSAKLKEAYRIYDQFGKDFTRTCKYDLTLIHTHRT